MEQLIELVDIANRQAIQKVEVLGKSNKDYPGKMQTLYDGILSGQFSDDESAALALYDAPASHITYKKLKYRFKNRLLNTIFFIDINQPNFNDFQRAYYSCHKAQAAVSILIGRSARKSGIALAERTLKVALQYEFSDVSIHLLKRLTKHYGAIVGDIKKHKKYSEILQKQLVIFNAETLAEEYYTTLALQIVRSLGEHASLHKKAQVYIDHLNTFEHKVSSNNFLQYYYFISCIRYELIRDYNKTLMVAKKAVETFESRKPMQKNAVYLFLFKMLMCHIQLKNYQEGETIIKKALNLTSAGQINWFAIHANHLILSFHSRQYQTAFEVFSEATRHSGFKKLGKILEEQWRVYEAFIHFFIAIKKINVDTDKVKKFRISKFLNEVPIYSADKRGFNIPILIIQVLFLLQQQKYGKVIDKVEALNAYCYRYLKRDDTFRSNCFIRLLLLLPKSNFNAIAVERKSKKLWEKLIAVPLDTGRQSGEIEIVPYEDLWRIVLEMIAKKE